MNPNLKLYFDGGYLRPLKETDIHPGYYNGLNDPEVNKFLFTVKTLIQTKESVTKYVIDNSRADNALLLGIWVTGNQHFSGTLRVYAIDNYYGTANLGICIFDKNIWGKGLGSKAIKSICNWCFDNLKLRWIEAGFFTENIASEKIFAKAGFKLICEYPDKYLLECKPSPMVIYAKKQK